MRLSPPPLLSIDREKIMSRSHGTLSRVTSSDTVAVRLIW